MRVLVCGGRDYDDAERVQQVLNAIPITTLIEGCANGADRLAERYVQNDASSTVTLLHFPADWDKHGKAAGPIRNRQMLVEGKPDLVVAFPGGRGTANMIEQATNAGIPVKEIP